MLRMPSAIELWWRTRSVGGAGTPDTGTHWHSRSHSSFDLYYHDAQLLPERKHSIIINFFEAASFVKPDAQLDL